MNNVTHEFAANEAAKATATILAVDDEPSVLGLYRNILRPGLDVLSSQSGKAALLKACSVKDVDLVILNDKLPDMGGLEVLSALRKALPSTPIILVTCSGNEAVGVKALRLGATDYIRKPFDISEFLTKIEFLLSLNKLATGPLSGKALRDRLPAPDSCPLAMLPRFAYTIQSFKKYRDDNFIGHTRLCVFVKH